MIARLAHGQARADDQPVAAGLDRVAVAAVGGDAGGDVVLVALELPPAGCRRCPLLAVSPAPSLDATSCHARQVSSRDS